MLAVKQRLAEALRQKAVLEAASDFYVFVKLLAPLMLDGNDYRDGKHIELLATQLQEVEAGDIMRMMMALPPGSMKSVLTMLWAAWCLGRHPTWRVMWISHTSEKAEECSGRVRDLVRSSEYQEIFPHIKIRDDKAGVTLWKLVSGGSFYPAGAGKSIAGYRFDIGILDDALSEQTAKSDVEREKINRWYGPGFRSRKLPRSRILIINTRWHTHDLQGFLLEQARKSARADQWEVISIPAILDEAAAEFLSLPAGGSYWPEYITMDDLIATREGLTRVDWAALYLQMPTPEDGTIFVKDDFREWQEDAPPVCEEIIQTLDTAFSAKKAADYSVIQTWGIFLEPIETDDGEELWEPHAILLHAKKGRWTYPELRREAKAEYNRFKPNKLIIENKASGQSLLQDLKMNKLPVLPFQPDRDKVARAHAATGIVERGRVWLPLRKAYALDLLKEALEFPKGAHDDQVDAMVMALLYLRRRYELTQEEVEKPNRTRMATRSYWRGARYGRSSRD